MIYHECWYISKSQNFSTDLNCYFKTWNINSGYNCFLLQLTKLLQQCSIIRLTLTLTLDFDFLYSKTYI